ncbi:Tetratricopeptide repeat-containing protein isoform 1 [Cladophialophora immunda]|nr:Tetratricopeptide repeat-containing protein isoform 1 [Cladophialophora immunda]
MLFAQAGEDKEAKEILDSLLPWLDANRSLVVSTPQLLYWAQQLLGRVSLGHRLSVTDSATIIGHESASFRLQAFRHWAVLAVKNQEVSASTYGNGPGHLSKLDMWRAYYRFLSSLLQNRQGIADHVSIEHSDLAVELRRVETSYENELLRNVQFPKATESNAAIEAWVEEFIRNWQILCGPNWSESDLGEGGRNSCGRNVLDMLYRAATKSFHSTLILRRLFQVHKALTDFGLAYKALDTYIELMDRARAGAAKSETPATGSDSDEVFMRTIAEGIEGLCSFGRYLEAEKAYELCDKLQDLLRELESPSTNSIPNGFATRTNGEVNGEKSVPCRLSPDLLEVTYRAIGIGKAQWARWTPFSEERTNLQTAAIECLQKAAAQDLPPERQLSTLYALSQLLAQTRDIDQAIATVKKALAWEAEKLEGDNNYSIQRQLVPFWHLLSLLLTSRQNFETASQSCVAAFEQFSPPETIFGDFPNGSVVGGRLASGYRKVGLVDDMECDELQKIIEIRITELALTELLEGPEHAVNNSNDLLALYSRLFGRHGVIAISEETSRKRSIQPPKSSGGTVRSLPGKLFHRKRLGRSSESSKGVPINVAPSIAEELRPNTQATQATQTTQAPTIQVTNEDGKASPHKHKIFHIHDHAKEGKRHSSAPLPTKGLRSRRSRSLSRGRKEPSHASSTRQSFETSHETVPSSEATAETAQPELRSPLETIQSADVPEMPVSPDHDASEGAKQPLKEIPHNLTSHEKVPPPAQHQDQPPQQDVRLPVVGPGTLRTDPIPRFPRTASQRHALSVLVKIWLIIATLYRRGNMFDDSREACDEAAKVALKIEGMVASVESSARAFSDGGWGGGGKSSDELWADVYCERAELLMAIARAREEKEGAVSPEGIREAVENYEQCLMYFADHPGGIVGLSNVLLDYYERKVELARRIDNGKPRAEEPQQAQPQDEPGRPKHKREWSRISTGPTTNGWLETDGPGANATAPVGMSNTPSAREEDLKKTPENLNRLAARDRAYGLLSTLTKLGSGWDNSEAWFALARAHELGGEVDRAKEILWWCVELEDTRPIRHWGNVGCGGYVL